MSVYPIGDIAVLTAEFLDWDGQPADPDQISLVIKTPAVWSITPVIYDGVGNYKSGGRAVSSSPVTFTYPIGIVRDSLGNYHHNLIVNAKGRWEYEWKGGGGLVAAQEPVGVLWGRNDDLN